MKIRESVLALGVFLAASATLKADELKPEASAVRPAAREAMRYEAVAQEYRVRAGQYEAGVVPINVVLQSNTRWLQASLRIGVPNAASGYDARAREIETLALRKLERGSGSQRELAEAREARLDALLKRSLDHSATAPSATAP